MNPEVVMPGRLRSGLARSRWRWMVAMALLVGWAATAPQAMAQLIYGNTTATGPQPLYLLDVGTGQVRVLLVFEGGFWGLAADDTAGELLAVNDSSLYRIPYDTLTPERIGTATINGSVTRLFGLAVDSTGTLWASKINGAAAGRGLYVVSRSDATASLVAPYATPLAADISGLDFDPAQSRFIGARDNTTATGGEIVQIDVPTGVQTVLAPYPTGVTQVDGLAIGNGRVYLCRNAAGEIHVLNLNTLVYETPLPSSIETPGVFAAGAWSPALMALPTPTPAAATPTPAAATPTPSPGPMVTPTPTVTPTGAPLSTVTPVPTATAPASLTTSPMPLSTATPLPTATPRPSRPPSSPTATASPTLPPSTPTPLATPTPSDPVVPGSPCGGCGADGGALLLLTAGLLLGAVTRPSKRHRRRPAICR